MKPSDCSAIFKILNDTYPLGLKRLSLHREMIGYVYIAEAGSARYVLKIYRAINTAQAMQSIEVIQYLARNGYPVVSIVPTAQGDSCFTIQLVEGACVGILYDYIAGNEPQVETDIEEIGRQAARLHALMASYPGELVRHGKAFYVDRFIGLLREMRYPDGRTGELAAYGEEAWSRMDSLSAGFCHGDAHTGNMIKTADSRIVLFDFDAASIASPVIDVATLCDRSDFNRYDENAYDSTASMFERFYRGYVTERPLSRVEVAAVFDFVAIRHYELIATIVASQGQSCIDEAFLDEQYHWLMDWDRMCRVRRQV